MPGSGLVARHETTATGAGWAVERILRNPPVVRAVRAELTAASSRADGEDAFTGLDYLDAGIKEALRSRPIVPIVARRVKQPIRIGGHDLPAGSVAAPCMYLMHHDPCVYPGPPCIRSSWAAPCRSKRVELS